VGLDAVEHLPGLDDAGPAEHRDDAHAALVGGHLFAAERRGAAVRPGRMLGSVIGGVPDDGVFVEAVLLQELQHETDIVIVLQHARTIEIDF